MIIKCNFILSIACLLFLSYVLGHKHHRNIENVSKPAENVIEESDRLMINQTGCKYLYLAKKETKLFTKDSGNLEHITMALVSSETPTDQNPKFELNFAVKSASDLRIFMFTRQHYVRISKSKPDYKIALGTNGNTLSTFFYTALSDKYENVQSYDLKNTSQILSAEKYEKFYITINDGTLKYGKHCDHEPVCSTTNLGLYRPEIVQIGFQSKSALGAKILYDCPSNFAACPYNAV